MYFYEMILRLTLLWISWQLGIKLSEPCKRMVDERCCAKSVKSYCPAQASTNYGCLFYFKPYISSKLISL